MKRQKLTPEQYKRTNTTMLLILVLSFIIYAGVDVSNMIKDGFGAMGIIRCSVYAIIIIFDAIVVKVLSKKKSAMLIMALSFLVAYAVLVFGNGAGTLVMAFPALIGFMIYLNTPVVLLGCVYSLIVSILKMMLLQLSGDREGFGFALVVVLGMLVAVIGAWRAITLLVNFSKENQAVIEQEAQHRAEVAETVTNIVEKIDKEFHEVLDRLGELNDEMETTSLSMEQIAGSSESTAEAIGHQAEMTGEIQGRLESANDTAIKAKEVTVNLQETVDNGKLMADDLNAKSVLVDQNTARISETVEELVQNVEKVSSITASILSISSQTNLLALNASIEAARAGEAGKGFAVVASEIGNLANSSADSVAHISKLIDEVRDLVDDAVKQAGNSAEDINESSVLIHSAIDTFENIYANIAETSDLIEHMIEKINQVDEVATNVAAISQEQAASTEEILATSETMLQQAKGIAENSKQVADESKSLTVSSEELSQQVKKFRI